MKIADFVKHRPLPAAGVILGIVALLGTLLYFKAELVTRLTPGDLLTVRLAADYQLRENETPVKIAGSEVGRVQTVDYGSGGTVEVVLKVRNGVRELLGTEPSAIVRPTTVLGGKYYIELRTGGERGAFTAEAIPVERTHLPVELDKVLSAIPPDSVLGLRGMTERLDATFAAGTGVELNKLLKNAPDTLRPAGVVLDGLRGINKDNDLAQFSTSTNTTAVVLSRVPGQLQAVVDSLAGTSRQFGDSSAALAQTISTLPETLRATRTGTADLNTTLDKLIDVADDTRPTVKALNPMLKDLEPALDRLRPVVKDLRPLLKDARPLLDELVPTVDKGTDVLAGAEGKPLDRINGPILKALNSPFKGYAPKYPNGGYPDSAGPGAELYKNLGYTVTNMNGAVMSQMGDRHFINVQVPAVSSTSPLGTGAQAEALQFFLQNITGVPHGGPNGSSRSPELVPGTGQGFQIKPPDPGARAPLFDPNALPGKGPIR
ncbi:MAG TPA: MlaD family protein [Pseudonocardia sp.]